MIAALARFGPKAWGFIKEVAKRAKDFFRKKKPDCKEACPQKSPLKFNNEEKIRAQMKDRGWTDETIQEALETKPIEAMGKQGPALRYVHPKTGQSVVVDKATGEIFHVGGPGYLY